MAKAALVALGLAVVLLLGEVGARVWWWWQYGTPMTASLRALQRGDRRLGWEGRRVFGDPASPRPKVLIVGDSMTDGLGVPSREMYYTRLGQRLGVEIFAYGGAGYGTLQELMVVEQELPAVNPDLVILQTSFNDVINNSWGLESTSHFNNNLAVRPYLVGERIVYRFPSRLGNYSALLAHSRLAYAMTRNTARIGGQLAARGWLWTSDNRMGDGVADPVYEAALATTDRLVGRLKSRVAPQPLVAFAADEAPYFRTILARHGVPYVETVPRRIAEAEAQGRHVRFDGWHWNAEGQEIAAAALADALRPYLPH